MVRYSGATSTLRRWWETVQSRIHLTLQLILKKILIYDCYITEWLSSQASPDLASIESDRHSVAHRAIY
ncbi:MAG: hypothetical protein ACFE0J_21385 [Elainellaceae cyanobacterium]